ncbi:MAG: PepSY domain-containing protein [Coprobacillus sp.]
MLKGLKIMFVGCMAIGATAFAYQMINVQDVQADEQTRKADVQSAATTEVKQLNNTQTNQPQETTVTSSKEIGIEKAKEIALTKVNGKVVRTETDDDDYQVYIEKDGYKYDIEIDRYRGTIDDVDKEKININQGISEEKAKQLALAKVNGKIVDIKSDDDDYNVYIEKDNYIYEIEVDRYRGVIDDVEKERKPSSNAQIISQEQAKQIALTKVNGTVREVEYDNDDYQYDVKVYKDMIEYEIKIDAKSGGVLEIEKDD